MAREKIHCFRCGDCPDCFIYREAVPKKVPGAILQPGGRYCQGGKKTRVFKRRDPKVYQPSWCPKLKSPSEYRVYAYKDPDTWFFHYMKKSQGLRDLPRGSEFAVRASGYIDMSTRNFWEEVRFKSASSILGISVYSGEVIEIDDGLRPYFFHVKNGEVEILTYFQYEKARENKYVERSNTSDSPTDSNEEGG